jgi:Domain of unknown function (DUF4832)
MLRLTVSMQSVVKNLMSLASALFFAAALACPALAAGAGTNLYFLGRSASPTKNPLKGFMPYSGNYTTFPHSMEWNYLSLRALMSGPTNFDWSSLETLLNPVASRGHQTVFRVYLDYPGKTTGLPQYLLDAGLATHSYTDFGNNGKSVSPDYENPLLRQALTNFIAALGARYDGDPRIGFITVGLLGFWGEWHTYPHTEWFASVSVQDQVLTAFTNAFRQTRLLCRYPNITGNFSPAALPIGYHDDSFAFSTIAPPSWHFLGQMAEAGETSKWQTQPIGGEVRPEVQSCLWDANQPSCVPSGQGYDSCVDRSHASWMLNHGAFSPGFTGDQKTRAVAGSTRLGYELYVTNAVLVDASVSGSLRVDLKLRNTGVAPFYYDWPVQLGARNSSNALVKTWTTTWKLSSLLPAATNTLWTWSQAGHGLLAGQHTLLLRVQNPLTNGVPFRFANVAQDASVPGWLTLGQVQIVPIPARPSLRGSLSGSVFNLAVTNAAPGLWWTVEVTTNLTTWTPLLSTNTSTPNWSITDAASASARFYRVVNPQ